MGGYDLHRSVRMTCQSLIIASSETSKLWVDNSVLSWRGETNHTFNGYFGIANGIYASGIRQLFENDDSFVTTEAMAYEERRGIGRLKGRGAVHRLRKEIHGLLDMLYERRRIVTPREIPGYTELYERLVEIGLRKALGLSHPDLTLLGATGASVRIAHTSATTSDGLLSDDTGIIAGAAYLREYEVHIPVYSRIMPEGRTRVEALRVTDDELDYFLEKRLSRTEDRIEEGAKGIL